MGYKAASLDMLFLPSRGVSNRFCVAWATGWKVGLRRTVDDRVGGWLMSSTRTISTYATTFCLDESFPIVSRGVAWPGRGGGG